MAPTSSPLWSLYKWKHTLHKTVVISLVHGLQSKRNFMKTTLADRINYPYQVPIPDCPHNIKSVHSAEFWYWIDINCYLVNVRLLLLWRENKDINKCVSLKALRNKDHMDVERAVEIPRKKVQDSIPEENVSNTLEEEWSFSFELPSRTDIFPKV